MSQLWDKRDERALQDLVAHARSMIRRLESHVGLSDKERSTLPVEQQVPIQEAVLWDDAVQEFVAKHGSEYAMARLELISTLYRGELQDDEGDAVDRALNSWKRKVALLQELQPPQTCNE